MNKGFAARVIVGAALVAGSIGVPTAAYAAPTSQSTTSHSAAGAPAGLPAGIDCGIVYKIAGPLLVAGLPIDLVLDVVFSKLGSNVPLVDIRSCFGL